MTEERVAFLFKASSKLQKRGASDLLLKSYYLIRCHELTKGYGLPQRQFAPEKRCSHCFLKWTEGIFLTKIKSVKLSKSQKRRIKRSKARVDNIEHVTARKNLLKSNEVERKCLFCNQMTTIKLIKPTRLSDGQPQNILNKQQTKDKVISTQVKKNHTTTQGKKSHTKSNNEPKDLQKGVNIYSNTKDVFALHNKNNIIANSEPVPKSSKNNKRKKDKFAGLCKEAVLATAKLKKMKETEKSNGLHLFLKLSK